MAWRSLRKGSWRSGRNSGVLDSEGRSAQQLALDVVIDDAIYDFRSGMLLAASSNSDHILCFSSDLRSRIELEGRVAVDECS